MSLNSGAAGRRRRGAELEEALLAAAWDELEQKGYDAFTIESVAARARTARAVIYRRWATKHDLMRAAILQHEKDERVALPDTGSLRGDLVEVLRSANRRRAPLIGFLVSAHTGAWGGSSRSLADVRNEFLGGRTSLLDQVLDRAVERGELDPERLTPRVRAVAFDLFRHEVLMTQRPVADEVIDEIVDDVVLPLVRRP